MAREMEEVLGFGRTKNFQTQNMRYVLFAALLAMMHMSKPWPTRFEAWKYFHVVKDSTAKHGGRFLLDSVHLPVEMDYVNSRVKLGDNLMIYDSVMDCPDGGDSEKVFVRGLHTANSYFIYLDRRKDFPSGYRMLFVERGLGRRFYDLRVTE